MDTTELCRMMARSRAFELVQADLWRRGLISGEMHQGTGEEAVIAGVVGHLRPGDAVSLDHRPSAAMLLLGVPAIGIIREMLGRPDGLCGGCGGHMHLFSPDRVGARAHSLLQIMNAMRLARSAGRESRRDPLVTDRSTLAEGDAERIDREAAEEMAGVVAAALEEGA